MRRQARRHCCVNQVRARQGEITRPVETDGGREGWMEQPKPLGHSLFVGGESAAGRKHRAGSL